MLIYLADLTHVGHGIATEAFPLNIGLVASYAKKIYGRDIDLALFKYPDTLLTAIKTQQPAIVGLSNYTWNSNLSYFVTKFIKRHYPNTVVVWGGTNYPFDVSSQKEFLKARPELDMHIFYEGEQAFSGLVRRVLNAGTRKEIFEQPLDGIQFLQKETDTLITGQRLPRLKELDIIPSPYAIGLLDKFFDGNLTPLVETTRGCPFRCNFCNAGEKYFDKINMFSDEYVRDELTYIAEKASRLGIKHITLADNNFGMYPRDFRTAQLLFELQQKYGWPKSVTAWTGKNAKERVIDVTRMLGETLSISMSVQSMDYGVLKAIDRGNIKIDHYRAISEELYRQGRPQHTEVIMPLPGETFESHISGLGTLLDLKVSRVFSHTLQMLHGTPYKDDPIFIERYGYQVKWRLVPLDFSKIEDQPVFDTEAVAVGTKDFSFPEYVEARRYTLIVDLCFNSGLFEPLKKHLRSKEIKISEWIKAIYLDSINFNTAVSEIYDAFAKETVGELWDSEQSLVDHYSVQDNYQRLIAGEIGGNVLFKHRVWMLSSAGQDWVKQVFRVTRQLLMARRGANRSQAEIEELADLEKFTSMTIYESFSLQNISITYYESFSYDILGWLDTEDSADIASFRRTAPLRLGFSFSQRNLEVATDGFRRYGSDLSGLIKLVQRSYFTFTRSAIGDGHNGQREEKLPKTILGVPKQ